MIKLEQKQDKIISMIELDEIKRLKIISQRG